MVVLAAFAVPVTARAAYPTSFFACAAVGHASPLQLHFTIPCPPTDDTKQAASCSVIFGRPFQLLNTSSRSLVTQSLVAFGTAPRAWKSLAWWINPFFTTTWQVDLSLLIETITHTRLAPSTLVLSTLSKGISTTSPSLNGQIWRTLEGIGLDMLCSSLQIFSGFGINRITSWSCILNYLTKLSVFSIRNKGCHKVLLGVLIIQCPDNAQTISPSPIKIVLNFVCLVNVKDFIWLLTDLLQNAQLPVPWICDIFVVDALSD